MARSHGRIYVTIWQDEDFLALSPTVQRLYMFLVSQPNLSHLGVLPLTLRRWAKKAHGYKLDDLNADLADLEDAGFVVVDEDSEELLIRTLLRGDQVYKQPNVMRAAIASAPSVNSDAIKRALLTEIDRLDLGDRRDADGLLASLREALSVPERDGPDDPNRTLPGTTNEGFGEGFPEGSAVGQGEPPTHARARPLPLPPLSERVRQPKADDEPRGFGEFWMAYPRKVGKAAAKRAYAKALKTTTPEDLRAAVERYARQRQGEDPNFTAHPASWLNAGRWEDVEPPRTAPVEREVAVRTDW
jgi:hypothetical protein